MTDLSVDCAQTLRFAPLAASTSTAAPSAEPSKRGDTRVADRRALERLRRTAEAVKCLNDGQLLIAAYGSLPGKPEPGLQRPRRALIPGYRKSLCISVATHRGTPERPGLVAGILPARDEAAMAMAFDGEPATEDDLLAGLARRELDGKAYDPKALLVSFEDGTQRFALGFAAIPGHTDVVELPAAAAARIVAHAAGCSGTNAAYLRLTLGFERRAFGRVTPSLGQIEALVSAQRKRTRQRARWLAMRPALGWLGSDAMAAA